MTLLRFAALLALACGSSGSSLPRPPAGSDLRKELARILASEEYGTDLPQNQARESFGDWIGRMFRELLESLHHLGESAPVVLWGILILCLLVLGAIFVHGGVIAVRALRAARTEGGTPLPRAIPRSEEAETLLERARGVAESGQFTEAIRLCQRAALRALDHRGLIRVQDALTSSEYARQLGAYERERTLFAALTRIYEPASFGKAQTTRQEYMNTQELAQKLLSGALP